MNSEVERKPLKIVITGASFSGKSTTIKYLSELGYSTIPEAAILVIQDLIDRYTLEGQKDWREKNLVEFQELIALKQQTLESEISESKSVTFLDRGILDGLAYLYQSGHQPSETILNRVKQHDYSQVFILDILPNYNTRSESGRTSDFAKAKETAQYIEKVYIDYGYSPIKVSVASVEERANFILSSIET